MYRLNSLLPLAGNPKSFLTFSVFIAVTKFWAPYGNLGSRTGIVRTHALASGSIQTQIARLFPQRISPFLLKHDRISPTFQKPILLTIYRQLLPKPSPPFLGKFMGKFAKGHLQVQLIEVTLDPGWSGFRPGHVTGG